MNGPNGLDLVAALWPERRDHRDMESKIQDLVSRGVLTLHEQKHCRVRYDALVSFRDMCYRITSSTTAMGCSRAASMPSHVIGGAIGLVQVQYVTTVE